MYNKLLRSVLAVAFAATAFAVAVQADLSSPAGGDVSWDSTLASKLGTADVSWDVLPASDVSWDALPAGDVSWDVLPAGDVSWDVAPARKAADA
ncbi:hypothetical protein FKN01_23875 [Streptomyces sp. 130]|uniref:hypothetical protein n=1 Tax=Streptomyces sp. 130 TaxID=2591006 RepID=UPI00117F35CE|nr:hypothetical protein [Streptomyces sp. 130]TRV74630.1 hypothetical protein FKN01_23875 [Streptomyces sp. 130]